MAKYVDIMKPTRISMPMFWIGDGPTFNVTKVWCDGCHTMVQVGVDKGISECKKYSMCPICSGKLSWQCVSVPEWSRDSLHVFDEIEVGRP